MQKRLNEPILLFKTARGGKSINTDFRPPSAGSYEFDKSVRKRHKDQGKNIEAIKSEKQAATGVYYRQTIEAPMVRPKNLTAAHPPFSLPGSGLRNRVSAD